MGRFRVGVGRTDITPKGSVELAGYGFYLKRKSRGVHIPIYSRALLLESGEERILILNNDLADIDERTIHNSRKLIGSDLNIERNRIIFTNTHTHSAPATTYKRGLGEVDESYVSSLPERFYEAAEKAYQDLKEASMGLGKDRLCGISRNRALEGGPIDEELTVIQFKGPNGDVLATIFNFPCHPTTIDVRTEYGFYISPDWPGCAMRIIDDELGGLSMFLQGTCGDIGPVVAWKMRGLDAAEEVGEAASKKVIEICKSLTFNPNINIKFKVESVEVPLERIDYKYIAEELIRSMRECEEKEGEKRLRNLIRFYREWAESMLEKVKKPKTSIKISIYGLNLGGNALIFLPGEIFVEIGLKIKELSPFKNTVVVGHTGKSVGYIPAPWDFDRRGYASILAPKVFDNPPYKREAGEIVLRKSLEILADLQ